jgi:hypothetical protein
MSNNLNRIGWVNRKIRESNCHWIISLKWSCSIEWCGTEFNFKAGKIN